MALAGMIRKASPSVVPLALRVIGSSTTVSGTFSAFRQRQSHCFSSAATVKDLVDERLYKCLEHELKSAKSNLKNSMVDTLPDSFPFIVEDDGPLYPSRRLSLKREFPDDDEDVIISIQNIQEFKSYHKTSLDDDASKDNKNSHEDDTESDSNSESDDEISVEAIKAPAIPMKVIVTKADGNMRLDFEITVSEEDILIKSIEINNEEKDYCVEFLEGPKFEQLDHGLQQSMYKYLEIRGIKRDIASILLKCIAMKNKKLDVIALKHIKKVIKK